MESAYHLEMWRDLFFMIGSAAGALVGLLFIVVSLHIDKINELADYNMRVTIEGARFNTLHLLTVLLEAAAVLTPQPVTFLGAELDRPEPVRIVAAATIIYKYFDEAHHDHRARRFLDGPDYDHHLWPI